MILEQFADNPFLPRFYEDRERHAFPLELYFMAERYKQITEFISEQDLFKSFTVSDYVFYKSLIFASNNLTEDESKLYKTLFNIINPNLPKPDIILYLHKTTENLLKNIKKRGRGYEQNISGNYLEGIHEMYMGFFKYRSKSRIVILDTNKLDFISKKEDYQRILEVIDQDYLPGIHFVY